MVRGASLDHAGAMSTNHPDAAQAPGPHGPGVPPPPPPGDHHGFGIDDLARLRRSDTDRKVAGVAGGIAEYFDIDPVIPRVMFAVLAFFGGAGLLLYGVMWLIVPDRSTGEATVRLDNRSRTVALVIAGVLASLALLGDSLGGWGLPWPVAVIGLILLVVMLARGREPRLHPLLRDSTPGQPTPGQPAPDQAPSYAAGQPTATAPGYKPPAPSRRRRGPILFPYALALIALACGVLGIADVAGASIADSAYPAVALGITAAMLLVGAFWGRPGGLILLGFLATFATAGVTASDEFDAGRISDTPTSAAGVDGSYDLSFGEIELDLTHVADVENLDGRVIDLEVWGGRVDVTVPEGTDVVVVTDLAAGDRWIFGDQFGDTGRRTTTYDAGPDAPELRINVDVTFGEIEINRVGASR